ncbi:MAG: HAMP domain-containing histidine kinase, partial [Planctomycetes bacterium]|nr:HAMP domain-containing histidine kinase [Planctomycetota bacterium]
MISIRRRLVLGTVLAVSASSALAGVAAFISVRAHLVAAADAKLRTDAAGLLALVRGCEGGVCWAGGRIPDAGGWVLVTDGSGRRLLTHPESAGALAGQPDGPVRLPDGGSGRMACAVGPAPAPAHGARVQCPVPALMVTLARPDTALRSTLATVAWALAGATAAATALAGLAAAALARAVLRPVAGIAGAIAGASPGDACIAVRPESVPRELRPVVERADAFLANARAQVERERRTAADIAHELRTPLAGLIATADLALARERSAADYRAAIERGRAIAGDTARLVERLLMLTRLEAGSETARREPIAGEAVLAACLADLAPVDAARLQRAGGPLADGVGDGDHLATVLRNLVGNAVAHAPPGSAIELHAEGSRLAISNQAPRL